MTAWFIGVVLSFNLLEPPVESHYQLKQFNSELSCLKFIVKNYKEVEFSAAEYFGEYEIEGKKYYLNNIELNCISLDLV
tara:strand:- start:5729 stop:5965 length:237 start_codon:yes stop_codon:yes gene_type:complete